MLLSLLFAISIATPDLHLELERESLTGRHIRYRQYIEGLPVVGGEVNVTIRGDGAREEHRALAEHRAAPRIRTAEDLVWVNIGGVAHLARRELTGGDLPVIRYVDVATQRVIREDVLYFPAKAALVFDPNPVAKLNAPDLRDHNDAPDAVPAAAYSLVELLALNDSGPLGGAYVQIADFQAPAVPPVDASGPLVFDRAHSGFEDVNTYFHVDRTQRHLQSLGYAGRRALVPYAVEADTHAAGGADNSFFIASATAGRGRLYFGEGGTDDAEDSDLIVHEYGHAIHEWISPGTFLGSFSSEARAISEGFGDYLAFSAKFADAVASGRDPFCFADWDARCWGTPAGDRCAYPPGSDCLRRLDTSRTVADFLRSNAAGTEHRNGEIWSAALADIFIALTQRYGIAEGRRLTDTLAIESLFGAPPHPGFATIARQMIASDRYLTGGRNADVICAAMMQRGILTGCTTVPRGEFTYFPGGGSGVVVPDNDATGVTLSAFVADPRSIENVLVSVNIRHRGRGELRVSLIAPDGTTIRLYGPSPERAPDLVTTFGRDSLPIESLDVLRGRSAAGEWRLRIVDVAPADVATVVSWGLLIQFAGEQPSQERPVASGRRQVIPVAGHLPGANETFFRTDLRILNRGVRDAEVMLVFTSSMSDGATDFAAVEVIAPPEQVIALDDVVRTLFATAGMGQLEIVGDVVASSRTWTPSKAGTFGLFAPAVDVSAAAAEGDVPHFVLHLRGGPDFRSNIGFAEVGGASGRVSFVFPDATVVLDAQPHTHLQVAVPAAAFVNGDDTFALVRVEGDARVIAYGATIDNRSGDPILIPAQRPADGGMRVIPAISAAGAVGTLWRTELSFGSERARLTYTTAPESITAEVTGVELIEDVIGTVFERPGTLGTLTSHGDQMISARIWTEGANGSYGQFVPFGEPSNAARREILHVERSTAFRTNIGLISDGGAVVRVTISTADGRLIRTTEHFLRPFQLEQFAVADEVVNGRATVETISGRVYAYASVVDNHTGDPIFVPAQE